MKWDAQAREGQVFGAGERLSFVDKGQLDDRHRDAMEQLRVLYDYPEGMPLDPFFANLAHSPEFFAGYMALGVTIATGSALSPRVRELAILRTAWLHGAPYAWGEHVHAMRGHLFTADEVVWITEGSGAAGWADLDRAVLRAVEDLHGDAMIGDAAWAALAVHLDERQLLELTIVAGHYVMTAYLQNTLRTGLTVHGQGLSAR